VPIILHAGSTAGPKCGRNAAGAPVRSAPSLKFLKIAEWTARVSPTASKTLTPHPSRAPGFDIKPLKQGQRLAHEIRVWKICMNLSGKQLEDQDQQRATPPASSDGTWWRRGLKLGELVPSWARSWIVIVSLVLVCIPIAAVLLGYLRRPASGGPETSSGSLFGDSPVATEAKPKPAPGKPFPPPSEEPAPPPAQISPDTAQPAPGNPQTAPALHNPAPHSPAPHNPAPPSLGTQAQAPAPIIPARPPVLPASPPPKVAPETYPARHDKHFGEGCSGKLTLDASGLVFSCPDDSEETLRVAFNQIASADDNGIKLTSGKKYHFTIAGMSKDAERSLFRNWLSRAR
jgi:hypothetical protein